MEVWDVQNKGNLYGKSARVEVVEGKVSLETIPPKYLTTVCKMPDLSEKSYRRARLIAAAPDLLAALEAVQRWQLEDEGDEDEVLNLVAEAIAKARGTADPTTGTQAAGYHPGSLADPRD